VKLGMHDVSKVTAGFVLKIEPVGSCLEVNVFIRVKGREKVKSYTFLF